MNRRSTITVLSCLLALACGDEDKPKQKSVIDELRTKAKSCGVLTDGKYRFLPESDDEFAASHPELATCMDACAAAATCGEVEQIFCGLQHSDRIRDCQTNCEQEGKQFTCEEFGEQIHADRRCDGRVDCLFDESDEAGCPARDEGDADARPEGFYCTDTGEGIPFSQLCNGDEFCADGSDEADCEAGAAGYTCKVRGFETRLPEASVCDRVLDCDDASDESPERGCAKLQCPQPEGVDLEQAGAGVWCKDHSRVLPYQALCNGQNDCDDGSDELSCKEVDDGSSGAESTVYCDDSTEGLGYYCDGVSDCDDHSDEIDCDSSGPVPQGDFDCGDGTTIWDGYTCDFQEECSNGADEDASLCGESFDCGDGEHEPLTYVCDTEPDCANGLDEADCDTSVDSDGGAETSDAGI